MATSPSPPLRPSAGPAQSDPRESHAPPGPEGGLTIRSASLRPCLPPPPPPHCHCRVKPASEPPKVAKLYSTTAGSFSTFPPPSAHAPHAALSYTVPSGGGDVKPSPQFLGSPHQSLTATRTAPSTYTAAVPAPPAPASTWPVGMPSHALSAQDAPTRLAPSAPQGPGGAGGFGVSTAGVVAPMSVGTAAGVSAAAAPQVVGGAGMPFGTFAPATGAAQGPLSGMPASMSYPAGGLAWGAIGGGGMPTSVSYPGGGLAGGAIGGAGMPVGMSAPGGLGGGYMGGSGLPGSMAPPAMPSPMGGLGGGGMPPAMPDPMGGGGMPSPMGGPPAVPGGGAGGAGFALPGVPNLGGGGPMGLPANAMEARGMLANGVATGLEMMANRLRN